MASPQEPITGYTFYTREEAARLLHASTRQVERWVAQKRLGFVRLGNRTLHTPEQIEAFVKASTTDPTAVSA